MSPTKKKRKAPKRYKMWITFVPDFKAGDPPPEGYVAWHEWAKVQSRAGLRQRKCPTCHLYMFPQEFSETTGERSRLICKRCAEARE